MDQLGSLEIIKNENGWMYISKYNGSNTQAKTILEQMSCDNYCDFQQCVILTSVDLDKPVQPPFKLRNSK